MAVSVGRGVFARVGHMLDIRIDDLTSVEIADFLEQHVRDMKSVSPPESKHALDLEGLRKPDITFWAAWEDRQLVGCGALKQLDSTHGEIKSMRTGLSHRRNGVATAMLRHILREAETRGYSRVSLETGAMPFFEPARLLYKGFGFRECEPFANYKPDPNSVIFTKDLRARIQIV
jgi:putative acetyltransferase